MTADDTRAAAAAAIPAPDGIALRAALAPAFALQAHRLGLRSGVKRGLLIGLVLGSSTTALGMTLLQAMWQAWACLPG